MSFFAVWVWVTEWQKFRLLHQQDIVNKKRKKWGIGLAVFGIGMFAMSYALVPLYYVLGHALHAGAHSAGHIGNIAEKMTQNSQPVTLDVVMQMDRKLPWTLIAAKQSRYYITPGSELPLQLNLYNRSDKMRTGRLYWRFTPNDLGLQQQSNNQNNYMDISLAPYEKKLLPINFKAKTNHLPNDIKFATMAIFIVDKAFVGHEGESRLWQKMSQKLPNTLPR